MVSGGITGESSHLMCFVYASIKLDTPLTQYYFSQAAYFKIKGQHYEIKSLKAVTLIFQIIEKPSRTIAWSDLQMDWA